MTTEVLIAIFLTGFALAISYDHKVIVIGRFVIFASKSMEYTEDGVPYCLSIALPEIDKM